MFMSRVGQLATVDERLSSHIIPFVTHEQSSLGSSGDVRKPKRESCLLCHSVQVVQSRTACLPSFIHIIIQHPFSASVSI